MTDVSVIGLGQMGKRLAELLIEGGNAVTVWNRTPAKAEDLRARGARVAQDAAAAIAASPVSIMILSDYPAVREILDTADARAALGARLIVNLGTNGPSDAIHAQALIAAHNGRYLDGAIQAAPSQMGAANTPILISGDTATFKSVEPLLRLLGGGLVHLGDAIDGTAYMDLATLSYVYGSFAGFLHGARLAEAKGISVATFGRIVREISPSFGDFYAHEAGVIESGDFSITESPMRISIAATQRILEESQALGVNTELPRFIKNWFDRADAAGLADEEAAALIKVLRM